MGVPFVWCWTDRAYHIIARRMARGEDGVLRTASPAFEVPLADFRSHRCQSPPHCEPIKSYRSGTPS
jgi:hypothetical protein